MASLPIQFSVRRNDEHGLIITTESGHQFRLSRNALGGRGEGEFGLDGLNADLICEEERPQLAHAIINEIIGAPVPGRMTRHAKTDQETRDW